MKILKRLLESKVVGSTLLAIIMTILTVSYFFGYLFWFVSRPLVALAHLLMLNPFTALEELITVKPDVSLKDIKL